MTSSTSDDLDKTSRPKRQFEKVIIPILQEVHIAQMY